MKFMKKAAALFFCLALALSVMAITAAADDPTFTVALELDTTSSTGVGTIDNAYYAAPNAVIKYNIKLTGSGESVDAFSFKVNTPSDFSGATYTVAPSGAQSNQAGVSETYGGDPDIHSFLSGAVANDFTTSSDGVAVGTVTFTLDGNTRDKTFTPTLSNITLTYRAAGGQSFTATSTTDKNVSVDPKFTVTLVPKTNADSTNVEADGTSVSYDYYYTEGLCATGQTTSANLPTIADINAYTNNNTWKMRTLPTSGGHGWASSNTFTPGNTINGGNLGDVTLEASFTAIEYSYTIKNNAGYDNDTGKYTVEDVADKLSALSTALTRTGYDFTGWTPSKDTSASPSHTEYTWGTTEFAASVAATTVVGQYGDVVITAGWSTKEFTITLINKTPNATTRVLEDSTSTLATHYTYAEGLTASDVSAAIAVATEYPGYTFTKWIVKSSENEDSAEKTDVVANWTTGDDATFDRTAAIPANKLGNITLEAIYTPIEYTVTYNLGGGTHTASAANYKVTDIATSDSRFGLSTEPTRDNYQFLGWTASGSKNSVEKADGATYDPKLNITTYTKNPASLVGVYGDVTFTAVWQAAGTPKFVDYAYAGNGNQLILFAITSENAAGRYLYDGNAMYDVGSAGITKYGEEFTDIIPTFIYAYIAASPDASKITVDTEGTANPTVTYDGNVLNDSIINAGDFGNVLTMLDTANDDFGFTNLTILSRLKADVDGKATGTNYGSITDAVEIAKSVGATRTAESAS